MVLAACSMRVLLIGFSALLASMLPTLAQLSQPRASVALPEEVERAIKGLHPGAAVLTAEEVDVESCGPEARRDQFFSADFNGDGISDYAALVRLGEPRQDREFKVVPIWLVVLLGQRDGKFRVVVLESNRTGTVPTWIVIEPYPPGMVWHWEGIRTEWLTFPGIGVSYCEKAGRVFYWSSKAGRFRHIQTSD